MTNDDLIRRGDALAAITLGATVTNLQAAIAALPAVQPCDPAVTASDFLNAAVPNAPQPLKKLGEWLAGALDEDEWPTAERYLNAMAIAALDVQPILGNRFPFKGTPTGRFSSSSYPRPQHLASRPAAGVASGAVVNPNEET